ncbi:hypothetical protein [Enterococcus sp. 5H]|uniref:hypothetical protein n=1 Tax=Enterococcus sp. 5H TaxID=1229490 RepID=UPI002303A963|nr:hypothetical protein [Enterococcus sp. 5H]MDA9470591.1 hypothetical protein [Enterococcus sp. 5H]
MSKRTRKEFIDYNEYRDRGMAYKWDTAFAIGELQQGINESSAESKRNLQRLPQQTIEEIEYLLDQALKYNKLVDIQLNSLDQFGRVKPHVRGAFGGFLDMDTVKIDGHCIDYGEIRHISAVDFVKWSDMDKAEDPFSGIEVPKEIDEFCDAYFNDGEFME